MTEIIYLVVAAAAGFASSKVIDFIKVIATKGEQVSVELSEAFAETSDVFKTINKAIENDEKIDANELKQLVSEGKEAFIAFKDVVISVKKK